MIEFNKMHGNGNDFIVINSLARDFNFTKKKISRLADRNKGIGFDQLIIIDAPTNKDADFFIKFFNSDGTSAKKPAMTCRNNVGPLGRSRAWVRSTLLEAEQAKL